MSLSSGTRNSIKLVSSWLAAAAIGVGMMTHFDEIRTTLGLKLEAEDLGLVEAPAERRAPPARASSAVETHRSSGRVVEIRANRSGHYEIQAYVNGRPVDVMVDTGATVVALTWDDARAAGIHVRESDFKQRVSTANGIARVAPVTLDSVSIADITVRDVRAVVAEPDRLETTLLGMSFLSRISKAEMSRGTLVLTD
jgi:aspartyl protease family protein